MKNLVNTSVAAFLIISLLSACGTSSYLGTTDDEYYYQQDSRPVSFNTFYDQLSPYGNWISYPGYGRVWIVNEPGFRPYHTNGRWVYTNHGWTWASNYAWGWAPFHYGRWAHDPHYGWLWVPGLEWAPAWVSWRGNADCYGWAPMSPNNWQYNHPYNSWVFVNNRYMTNPNISNYYISPDKNDQLVNNTTVVRPPRNVNYNPGPAKAEVEQYTGEAIRPVKVTKADMPDKSQLTNDELRVFRPDMEDTRSDKRATSTEGVNNSRAQRVPSNNYPADVMLPQRNVDRPVERRPVLESPQRRPESNARPRTIDREFGQQPPAGAIRRAPAADGPISMDRNVDRQRNNTPQRNIETPAPRAVTQPTPLSNAERRDD